MKKVMLACCLLFGGLIAVHAQDSTSTSTPVQQYPTSTAQDDQDQDRERINSRDLPDAVKRSLEGTEYRGWLVNASYKTTGVSDAASSDQTMASDSTEVSGNAPVQSDSTGMSDDPSKLGAYGQEVFVVELKNGAQTKTVRFDKEGKKLDDEGADNDQK